MSCEILFVVVSDGIEALGCAVYLFSVAHHQMLLTSYQHYQLFYA